MTDPAFCGVCGRAVGAGEFLLHDGMAICGECKDGYFQRLREHADVAPTGPYPSFWLRVKKLIVHILWTSAVYGLAVRAFAGITYRPLASLEPLAGFTMFLGALYAIPRLAARGNPQLRNNLVTAFLFPSLICFAGLLGAEVAFMTLTGAFIRYYNLYPRMPDEFWSAVVLFITVPIVISLFVTVALLVAGVRQRIAKWFTR